MSDDLPVLQAPLNKARKDKFELILTIPNILKTINVTDDRSNSYINLEALQFSVYGLNVPNIEVSHVENHYAGQTYNVTSFDRPSYPPATVNFAVDNEFKNYWLIWKWLQLLNDAKSSTYGRPNIFAPVGGYPQVDPKTLYDYTTTITANGLDEYNNKKVEFIFSSAFAIRLGNFSYNYRDPEEIDCSFDFVFNQLDINLL